MQGYQFAHLDLWSRKGRTGCPEGGTAKRHNGQTAWTVAQILDEVERRPGACEHIIPGRPPLEVLPGTVTSIAELRDTHDKASSVREKAFTSEIVDAQKRKTGKTKTVRRRLRSDASTLYTCIVSLPVLAADALADPDLRAECMSVLTAAMEHERKRVQDLGGTLACGVVHWDEEMVHAHFYGLDMTVGRVDHLHPGRVAKAAYYADNQDSGLPGKDRAKNANRRYCEAMRGWQDDLHDEVFSDAGLLRYGPRRYRLSRPEYKELKAAKEEIATTKRTQKEQRQERQTLKEGWQRLGQAQRDHAALVESQEQDLERQRDEIAGETRTLAGERKAAAIQMAEAKRATAEAEAGMAAVEALAAELLVVENENGDSRVKSAAGAQSHPLWAGLWARISPAGKAAAKVARMVEEGLKKLRQQAKEEGMAQARKEARAELDGVRIAMESALEAAGRMGAVARSFAAKLAPLDRDTMVAQLEAATREAAKAGHIASRAEAGGRQSPEPRPRRPGGAMIGPD